MTKAEVLKRIKGLDEETQKKMVCALVGHSKIHDYIIGAHYCARCGELVGDTLASIYPGANYAVVVGHNCPTCRENYNNTTWRDRLLAPEPFTQETSNG